MSQLALNPDALFAAAIGSLFTILVTLLINVLVSREKIKAIKRVLLQEIEVCADSAKTFSEIDTDTAQRVMAPLYRLPNTAFLTGLREIIGALAGTDANALIQFYSQVATLNRGLDLADATLVQSPGQPRGVRPDQLDGRNL